MPGPGVLPTGLGTHRGRTDWARIGAAVRGPLLTLAAAIAMDIMARQGFIVASPFPVLFLTVVYAAYSGGLGSGLISALVTTLYALHFFADPRTSLHYSPIRAYSLLIVAISAPATAVLVARLQAKARRARGLELTRAEAEALDRRLSFFAEANRLLANSLDRDATLRELARLMVPTVGDWCAIHVAADDETLRFIAGAHRDPARDLLVRALCDYGTRAPPFGPIGQRPELREVTEELLQERAQDEEQLKIYRALTPTSLIRVPLLARGRLAGLVTAVTARESGRHFSPADLAFVEELTGRLALTVEHGRLEQAAQEADRRYRLLFDANPQPMWIFDVESLRFLAVNQAALRQYGYSRDEFLAMTVMDIRPPEDTPGLTPGIERPHREEVALTQHQRKDGSIVDVEIVSHELELEGRRARLVLATDISDRTRARAALHQSEEQLRNAQRMDAVGRLASGVAHDFNNLLTTIRGFSDLLIHDLPPGDQRRTDADQIRKAADRGALLTRQLLAFSRMPSARPRAVNLNAVVQGMEALLLRLVGAEIQLETRLAQNLGSVRVDPAQLEQVLVNLVLNARDAMPNGGRLTVETTERQITAGSRSQHVRPGHYAVLAVSDTGSGMDGETLSGLFEPFAKTTPQGERTGLGLSTVYGIIRQAGGVVRVSSEPGQGTTVKTYIPLVEETGDEPPAEATRSLRGDETILVAEDEEGVRQLVRKILTEHGHTVLEARHGRDALLMAERYQAPIHLVITDVVMPEMNGGELVEALQARRPGTKVLYISGYTNDEVVRRGVSGAEFIQKPFTGEELMSRVRAVLDGVTAPSA